MPVATRSLPNTTRHVPIELQQLWRKHGSRTVNVLTVVHALVALVLLVLLCGISEDWWFSAALSYLPRAPYLAFTLAVIPAVALRRWSHAAVNILCGLLIAGPVMGLCAPPSTPSPAPANALVVVSCNIQNGDSNLPELLAEIDALRPDIVALQETRRGWELIDAHFAGWHSVDVDEYQVVSRFPIRLIGAHTPDVARRETAMLVEIDAPHGTLRLCNVHLNTARYGLSGLRWHSVLSGAGVDDLRWQQWERRLESADTREFVEEHAGHPMLVVGDFNTPTSSSLFQDVWSGWQSAFDTAGWGYGYTSPCNTGRLWPHNTPWLRIDHVLCDSAWTIHAAGIGRTDGSDHRLLWTRISLNHDRR